MKNAVSQRYSTTRPHRKDPLVDQAAQTSDLESINVSELIEALNDPAKTVELMEKNGWTQDDLLARAEMVSKRLASGIANICAV
jgi:hypothetical protein